GGERLFFLYIEKRQFTLFSFDFNAQDVYLVFFILTGLAFLLFFVTAVFGRIWCGWLCPQTLLLEGIYRKVERWIDGSKSAQRKRQSRGESALIRTGLKFLVYVLLSIFLSIVTVYYFVPLQYFSDLINQGLSSHPVMLFWILLLFALFMFDFAWFREQVCVILCPYGRLQSALTDDDTIVIGYDENRGEPRGKKGKVTGDCIDCYRCVEVCPTGIDIRNGLQLECVGCANCIDACDEIMEKSGKSKGLIRYDSLHGLWGQKTKIMRPRVYVYSILMLVGMSVFFLGVKDRQSFESNMLRATSAPFTIDADYIQNVFELHLVNKSRHAQTFFIEPQIQEKFSFVLPYTQVRLEAFQDKRIPLIVRLEKQKYQEGEWINCMVRNTDGDSSNLRILFLGP
ncbi:MAG: cytochrome c oxidase accessory protein CcoG, partial [Bdellovibrionales bacterium]|nr:cytochrome c oxidase accessory protein CcoG [Bdellovibrionales bacterium]